MNDPGKIEAYKCLATFRAAMLKLKQDGKPSRDDLIKLANLIDVETNKFMTGLALQGYGAAREFDVIYAQILNEVFPPTNPK